MRSSILEACTSVPDIKAISILAGSLPEIWWLVAGESKDKNPRERTWIKREKESWFKSVN